MAFTRNANISVCAMQNMCVTAAYRPVRELLNKLKTDKEAAKAAGQDPAMIIPQGVRPLSMDDLRKAKEQVGGWPPVIITFVMGWNIESGGTDRVLITRSLLAI